jgi:hypothetical protein
VTGEASITARVLGVVVTVTAPTPLTRRLRHEFADLLADRADQGRGGASALRLSADGTVGGNSPGVDPMQNALAEITRHAVMNSPLLCIHAGVVAAPDGVIAIPGTSGHGKTTLVAALVREGFGYLSDEVLALDRDTAMVSAFPRPLALDAQAWAVLDLDASQTPESERLVDPRALGGLGRTPLSVTDIVVSTRRPGSSTITPAEPGVAMTALLGNAFNHYVDGSSSFAIAAKVARTVRAWRASYGEAPELAGRLATHFGLADGR